MDRAIELLKSNCRRRLVRYLLDEASGVVERDELARPLHTELDMDPDSVRTVLAHHHLPKLAHHGIIEYDHRSGSVRPTGAVEDLAPLLRACEKLERGDT